MGHVGLTRSRRDGLVPIIGSGDPDSTLIVDQHQSDSTITLAVRTDRSGRTAEVRAEQPITAGGRQPVPRHGALQRHRHPLPSEQHVVSTTPETESSTKATSASH
ncbi:hypothetical protein GCM10011609_45130 [Lentzea pudingi]|uniref:Uncharacterized protein n=1 Tax=Lentzea pudingi TaxID=1789439 RepID=A0ABQ2I751_9PSEU|nr:hypothetical protein [Lentzea pudingi]GGN01520.1 hypothetical protein GCM10011609_45130 [Lentzea pudingi]